MGSEKNMTLETDPKRIEELAREKEDANWAFRCFLKACDLSVEEIDSVVHELYETISSQIDCLQCANCCKVVRPLLKFRDIKRLATHLGLPVEEFMAEYLEENEDDEGHFFKSAPCPFLDENSCTIYAQRPNDCRSYPHLHKHEFVFRLNQAFSNCSVCPIVYNVYEQLKQEMQHRRVTSYFSEYE